MDKYAELTLGKRGNRDIETVEGLNLTVNADYLDIVNSGLALIGECRSHWMTGIDDDMLNTLADMSTAFNHAKFFLIL